eukprot:COSAG02_NODE_34_length_49821_cov_105.420438_26_plen_91_part_00
MGSAAGAHHHLAPPDATDRAAARPRALSSILPKRRKSIFNPTRNILQTEPAGAAPPECVRACRRRVAPRRGAARATLPRAPGELAALWVL